jgi:hypothetical protein
MGGSVDFVVPLVAVFAFFAHPATPLQAGSTPAAGQTVRACAVLTKDLVAPFTENKKVLDVLPPSEEALGTSGTACTYGAVRMQLFPGRGGKPTVSAPGLQPVSGAGDGGLFRSNRNRYAELMVWTSKYRVDLQVDVPSGRTAEAIKPDVIALANAILKKLP